MEKYYEAKFIWPPKEIVLSLENEDFITSKWIKIDGTNPVKHSYWSEEVMSDKEVSEKDI